MGGRIRPGSVELVPVSGCGADTALCRRPQAQSSPGAPLVLALGPVAGEEEGEAAVNERGLFFWQQGRLFFRWDRARRPRSFATPLRRHHGPQDQEQPRMLARAAKAGRAAQYSLKQLFSCIFVPHTRFPCTGGSVCFGMGSDPLPNRGPCPQHGPAAQRPLRGLISAR